MFTTYQLQAALGSHGFVHVGTRKPGQIVKLMRTAAGALAVKTPEGAFTEFAADAWKAVARHINKLFGLKAKPRPRLTEDEKWERIVETAKAATAKLREFDDTLCWRGQYKDGSDRPSFGSTHYVSRQGMRGAMTLCGKPVPQHLVTYERDLAEYCHICERAHKRLEAEAAAGGY